jgi:hypothetical protein
MRTGVNSAIGTFLSAVGSYLCIYSRPLKNDFHEIIGPGSAWPVLSGSLLTTASVMRSRRD